MAQKLPIESIRQAAYSTRSPSGRVFLPSGAPQGDEICF